MSLLFILFFARLIFRQVQQLLIMPNKENAWEASAILHFEERRRIQEEADEKWLGRCAVATFVPFQKSSYTTILFLVLELVYWVVVSNIVYFHPYLGKCSILTNIFQKG